MQGILKKIKGNPNKYDTKTIIYRVSGWMLCRRLSLFTPEEELTFFYMYTESDTSLVIFFEPFGQ